jgi:probable phosphoglycerate mutase
LSASNTITNTNPNTYKVFVLRHGQTDANAGGIIQGSSDFSRLTPLGKQQAAEAARQAFHLTSIDDKDDDNTPQQQIITSLYCSPLRRAQETLQVLRAEEESSLNLNHHEKSRFPPTEITLEQLREIDFYDWEGRDKMELERRFPVSWKAWEEGDPEGLMVHHHHQNEEKEERYPLLELWNRADQVWDEIMEHEQVGAVGGDQSRRASLIVAHGSLGQALLGTAMGWGPSRFREYEFPNCGMVEIEWNMDDYWSSLSSSQKRSNKDDRRPLATRWRWKWPVASADWNTGAVV